MFQFNDMTDEMKQTHSHKLKLKHTDELKHQTAARKQPLLSQ